MSCSGGGHASVTWQGSLGIEGRLKDQQSADKEPLSCQLRNDPAGPKAVRMKAGRLAHSEQSHLAFAVNEDVLRVVVLMRRATWTLVCCLVQSRPSSSG